MFNLSRLRRRTRELERVRGGTGGTLHFSDGSTRAVSIGRPLELFLSACTVLSEHEEEAFIPTKHRELILLMARAVASRRMIGFSATPSPCAGEYRRENAHGHRANSNRRPCVLIYLESDRARGGWQLLVKSTSSQFDL
jgi:hypothetical protein